MDKRLISIRKKLGEYAVGKFDNKPLALSDALDETDAIMTGINILGEELEAATISRDYFNNIFNSVTDMVFVVNSKGIITDCNLSALTQLGNTKHKVKDTAMQHFLKPPFPSARRIHAFIKASAAPYKMEYHIINYKGEIVPVQVTVRVLQNGKKPLLLLFTATDISFQQQASNLIIRTIIETQEKERDRLSRDLHDGLAQQLHGLTYYINTTASAIRNKTHKEALLQSNLILKAALADITNICLQLMPRTLDRFGLTDAINELCQHFLYPLGINYKIHHPATLPTMNKDLLTNIFRIVQELMNNVIKHAKASFIEIKLLSRNNILYLKFSDNGKGFVIDSVQAGMGLANIKSRIKSHYGKLEMKSTIGKGTIYNMRFPILNTGV